MKASRIFTTGLLLVVVLMGLPVSSSAIPAFARKYGFACTMCHSNIPRLNDFGTRYRQNGYQLPGREHDEKTVLQGPAPIAFRTSAGYTYESFCNVPGAETTNHFALSGLDLFSAGLLGHNIGYFVVYTPEIAPSRNVDGQTGELESANVVFSNIGSRWINLRAGRFEPGCVAFSVKRQLSIAPYDIYDYGSSGTAGFSSTQTGIELTGSGPALGGGSRIGYTAGWVNGSETNQNKDAPTDAYARLAFVLGPGEGQTAGQRIGITGYFGKARPEPDSLVTDDSQQSYYRIGADASLNAGVFNLAVQYLFGKDKKELWGLAKNVDISGGFAELTAMPRIDMALFARYDMVNTPTEIDEDTSRITGGARYYFVDNLALHLEYSYATQNATVGDDPSQNSFWARLDFAF